MLKNLLNKLERLRVNAVQRPGLIASLSLLATLAGNFLLQLNAYLGLDYHSDDISQQVLTHKWLSTGLSGTWLGPDPFFLKVPLHYLVEVPFGQTRVSVLASGFLLSGSMLVLMFFGLRHFVRNNPNGSLGQWYFIATFPWVGSIFSYAMMTSLKNANLRTIELGIFILALPLAAKILAGKYRLSRKFVLWTGLAAATAGFLAFNDSAMVYFFLLPLAAFAVVKLALNKRVGRADVPPLQILGFVSVSLVFYKLWHNLFDLVGFNFYHSTVRFVEYDKFYQNISNALYNLLALFNADIFGAPLAGLTSLVKLLNFGVLTICVLCCAYLIRSGKGWVRFFALQPPYLFMLYAVSGFATDVSTARYLILLPAYFCFLLVITLAQLHRSGYLRVSVMVTMLVCLTFFANTISYTYWGAKAVNKYRNGAEERNHAELMVARIANENGIGKGYATFGYANLIDYFSSYKTNVTPIFCGKNRIQPFYLLMTDSALSERSNGKSFVLSLEPSASSYVADEYPALNLPAGMDYSCSQGIITKQLGQPDQSLKIKDGIVMNIYNHDVLDDINMERNTMRSPID